LLQSLRDFRLSLSPFAVPVSFREDRRVFIGEEGVRIDVLTERVRQLMANRTDRQVFLRGDGGVTLQELLDVMDRLKAGGVDKVGIVNKLPGEQ
ncbi:MAG: biopolymer transporter ExbD, partial [Vicinamibacterales bacterium]